MILISVFIVFLITMSMCKITDMFLNETISDAFDYIMYMIILFAWINFIAKLSGAL